jgi:dipeptidyl aminopeptidase/acylaminoacyl peptidase
MTRLLSRRVALALVGAALASIPAARASAELPPLVPRDILFGNPEKASARISPDGKRLAYIAPDKKNVLQVWVKTVGKNDDKVVTEDKRRGIRQYHWTYDNKTLIYAQDSDGDENFHLYGVDLDTLQARDFTPFVGVKTFTVDVNPKHPHHILVGMNLRNREVFDVHKLDLRTGEVALDTENPGDVLGWTTDDAMVVRGATATLADGSTEVRVRDGAGAPWRPLLKVPHGEDLSISDFTLDGKAVYLVSSQDANTTRVIEKDLQTGREKVVADSPKADAAEMLIHPTRHVVQAVEFAVGRQEWKVVDPTIQGDFKALAKVFRGDFYVTSRDLADRIWTVSFTQDKGSDRAYTWDRKAKKASLLFTSRPKLDKAMLSEMRYLSFPARDGLELHAYLTLPVGVPSKNLPMVLLVHGGPWYRDSWGFDPESQWLANRGYAVLQVNFRGSTGFGKAYVNAGDKQWGLKMHDDLVDAVQWAVKKGYADPKRVAIMGGSYGGYAALAGAAFTPELFRCAVDIVGPSSLFTLIGSIPPYWKPMRSVFDKRVGNVDDPKDAELLRRASPLYSAEKIKIPMLIAQGANDPRVKQAESEQIVEAIAKNGKQATYVLYPDEGHGFARPENRIDFYARAEAFLAQYLGGRAESFTGDKVAGSTAVVRTLGPGAEKTGLRVEPRSGGGGARLGASLSMTAQNP